jgi:hypothetical protein
MGRDITTSITCDTCGKDLTGTSYAENYRLVLRSESMWSYEGAVFAMAIPPPIDREYVFCDLRCLRSHPIVSAESLRPDTAGKR